MIIEDLEQLSARPVTRVILRDPTRSDSDFIALARHLGLHGVTYFVGWSAWLDIAPEGVNKATALAEVAEGLGVSAADVLAFGDGRNDIEMLRWAGRGLAIGDAPDEVQGGGRRRHRPVHRRRPRRSSCAAGSSRCIASGPHVSIGCERSTQVATYALRRVRGLNSSYVEFRTGRSLVGDRQPERREARPGLVVVLVVPSKSSSSMSSGPIGPAKERPSPPSRVRVRASASESISSSA